jgi:hypothetical protein
MSQKMKFHAIDQKTEDGIEPLGIEGRFVLMGLLED